MKRYTVGEIKKRNFSDLSERKMTFSDLEKKKITLNRNGYRVVTVEIHSSRTLLSRRKHETGGGTNAFGAPRDQISGGLPHASKRKKFSMFFLAINIFV